MRRITLFSDSEWDVEVDVVCADAGLAGLATAIAADEQNAEVFLAGAAPLGAGSPGPLSLGDDDETAAYLGELTADLDVATLTQLDADLPIRLAPEPAPAAGRTVPPFEGWRLRAWAARCVPSPSGYIYTQVTDWTSTTMDCGGGDRYEVTEIGEIAPDPGDLVGSVREWLVAQALRRRLSADPVDGLDRLVFEGGVVTGAVFRTATGPLAVRARHGVLLVTHEIGAAGVQPRPPAGADLRVALVGKEGSRFGRVELLTSDADVAQVIPLR